MHGFFNSPGFGRVATIGVVGSLLMASCGVGAQPSGQAAVSSGKSVADSPELPTPANSSAKVTYQDRAVVFDRATWKKEVRAISSNQTTYTFDGASAQAKQLQPGKTLFLYGRALRKVTTVQSQGGQLVVSTENAALTDLVKDGTIKWNQPVDFSKGFLSGNTSLITAPNGRIQGAESPSPDAAPTDAAPTDAVPSPDMETPPPDSSPSPVGMSGSSPSMAYTGADGTRQTLGFRLAEANPLSITVGNYKLSAAFTPTSDRLNVTFTAEATSGFGGGTVMVEGKGFIKKFSQSSAIEIRSGNVASYSQQESGADAEMTITWNSKKDDSGTMASTTILKPQVSYNAPFAVGGIPMFTEIGAGVAVIPSFSTRGSANASFKVSYRGNQGIDYSKGKVGGADNHSGSFSIENSTLVSPSIIGMTALVTFPKVTIGFGWREPGLSFDDATKGVSAAGWTDLLFTMSSLTTGLVNAGTGTSCVKSYFSVKGRVGMEFKILGIELPNPGPQEIWKKDVKKVVPPGSPLCEKLPDPE